jgi:hypothetical protein
VTAPIRVRRRWKPDERSWARAFFDLTQPWRWGCLTCHVPNSTLGTGTAPTHPAALAAGLAHLDTHAET